MNYKWYIKDGYPTKNGYKVFSCFACGGGSTMGYKKSGFEVLGCNEIDKNIIETYKLNHNPKFAFNLPIQEFSKWELDKYPKELFELDILDGSPPCSSFSMAGSREKDWGKEKKFKEGQALQVLDTLFFDFILLAKKLQPKVVISENVKGMLMGSAKEYFHKVMQDFNEAGYETTYFLLDGEKMGLPQKRQRVFFISIRKDILEKLNGFPQLDMNFYEKKVTFEEATREFWTFPRKKLSPAATKLWPKCIEGTSFCASVPEAEGNFFNWLKVARNKPAPTLIASHETFFHPVIPGVLNEQEYSVCMSYPLDYKVTEGVDLKYLCGMSVPPLMIQKISEKVKINVLDKIKNC